MSTGNGIQDKIETIKEILVGENLRAIQDEIAKLRITIEEESAKLQQKIDVLENTSNSKIANVSEAVAELKKEFTELISKMNDSKLDKKHFVDLFDKVVKNVK